MVRDGYANIESLKIKKLNKFSSHKNLKKKEWNEIVKRIRTVL